MEMVVPQFGTRVPRNDDRLLFVLRAARACIPLLRKRWGWHRLPDLVQWYGVTANVWAAFVAQVGDPTGDMPPKRPPTKADDAGYAGGKRREEKSMGWPRESGGGTG